MRIGDEVIFAEGKHTGIIRSHRQGRNGTLLTLERTSGSKIGSLIEVPASQVAPMGGRARQQAHADTGRFGSVQPNHSARPQEDYTVYQGHNPASNRQRQKPAYTPQFTNSRDRWVKPRTDNRYSVHNEYGYRSKRRNTPTPVHPLVNALLVALMALVVLGILFASLPK